MKRCFHPVCCFEYILFKANEQKGEFNMKPIRCPQCKTRIVHLVKEGVKNGIITFMCVGCDIEFDIKYQ
jgi:uncharacterized protein with PIN domain